MEKSTVMVFPKEKMEIHREVNLSKIVSEEEGVRARQWVSVLQEPFASWPPRESCSQPCHTPGWLFVGLTCRIVAIRCPPQVSESGNRGRVADRRSPSLFLWQEKPFVPGT